MVSSVSGANPTLSFTKTTAKTQGAISVNHFYATGVSGCGSTTTLTFTMTATPVNGGSSDDVSATIWFIQNAGGGLDPNFPCNSGANDTSTSFPRTISNSSCTTSVANEGITIMQQEDFQTVTSSSVTSGGTIYDAEADLGQYEALASYQDGGAAVVYATTAQGYTVSWTYSKYDTSETDIGNWAAQALAWEPSGGGGGTTIIPALPLLGTGVGD